jgi:uncharacterized protein (DUF2236 family)
MTNRRRTNRDRASYLSSALARFEPSLIALTGSSSVPQINYLEPPGDPGVFGPGSVTWRVLSNPASVFIGGVTAVLLELAEPRVRSAVWDHTDFRGDPVGRIDRTGLAAMVFTYGCRRDAEATASRVRRLHERVKGITPDGQQYRADDPELLTWVYVTAGYGFHRLLREVKGDGTRTRSTSKITKPENYRATWCASRVLNLNVSKLTELAFANNVWRKQ